MTDPATAVARREAHLRQADQQHAESLARLDHAINYSRSGLHAAMIANGGALVGLFTLIAPSPALASMLWGSGLGFSAGMLLTMLSWLLATMAQDRFQMCCTFQAWNAEAAAFGRDREHNERLAHDQGTRCLYGAYGSAIASLLLFLAGCLMALHVLANTAR